MSLSSASSELSSMSTRDQLDSFSVSLPEDTPDIYLSSSSSLPPTTVNVKNAAILPFHPAEQVERLPTNEIEDTASSHSSAPNVESSLLLLLRTELATTRALLASSKDTNLVLQERIKQLEESSSSSAAAAQVSHEKQPRDRRGRFVTKTTSVQKAQRPPSLDCKASGGRRRRRTQTALLMEAAIKCGYVNVRGVSAGVPGHIDGRRRSGGDVRPREP